MSKEVENSIKREDRIKNIIIRAKEIYDKRKENNSSSEPSLEQCLATDILNLGKYISELEKRAEAKNLFGRGNAKSSIIEKIIEEIDKEYLDKEIIREKRKELEEEDLEIYDTDSEDVRIAKFEKRAQITILEEISGERHDP